MPQNIAFVDFDRFSKQPFPVTSKLILLTDPLFLSSLIVHRNFSIGQRFEVHFIEEPATCGIFSVFFLFC